MCHIPSSYVVVEDVGRVLVVVMAGDGAGGGEEMLAATSGPFASGCNTSGECAASGARFELTKEIEAIGIELEK